ncbi:MAG: nucleotidyltransferase domain-containing protein [Brachyspira sp.]|nr:nucleotidyltransferase domain-containing protein [Brachyspira sp.]
MDNLFVKPQYLKMLTDIFEQYCPNAEIWAYGSRVNGDAHEGSDLDMVVKNFHSNTAKLSELRELITNSNIPFLTDINEFDKLPKYFQDEILKKYVVIFNK